MSVCTFSTTTPSKTNMLLTYVIWFACRYAFVWVPLLHSFFWNSSNADQGPPAFVTAIIISQAVLFSCFGLVQFVILFRSDGPSVYFYGEFAYQVLSLAAKGVLGTLLFLTMSRNHYIRTYRPVCCYPQTRTSTHGECFVVR